MSTKNASNRKVENTGFKCVKNLKRRTDKTSCLQQENLHKTGSCVKIFPFSALSLQQRTSSIWFCVLHLGNIVQLYCFMCIHQLQEFTVGLIKSSAFLNSIPLDEVYQTPAVLHKREPFQKIIKGLQQCTANTCKTQTTAAVCISASINLE